MLRAATTGMIDFTLFDPWDMWWWRKLRWVLDELDLQQTINICKIQHSHWTVATLQPNLTAAAIDQARTNSGTALNQVLKATYPWLAEQIGEAGTKTDRENAVSEYHARFGKPGEPQYELMVDTLYKALKKGKLTQREKEKARAERRRKKQEAMEVKYGG